MSGHDEHILDSVAFLGEATGPLFLYEPGSDEAAALYGALGALEVEQAAREWPFAEPKQALEAFTLINEGLAFGVDEDLTSEYRRLFVGPAPKAAPPWGSVYTDRECVIFGATTLALRAWLRESGIQVPGNGKEPEDHIGLMLLLMGWITRHRPELLDAYLADHLLPWGPHLLSVVQRESQHPFFQGLALLTASSLEGIQQVLSLDVAVPRFYR